MTEYIKRSDALNMLNRFFKELEGNEAQVLVSDIKHAVLDLPVTINVEGVTRCESCCMSTECAGILYCTYFNKNVEPDGFCSEG